VRSYHKEVLRRDPCAYCGEPEHDAADTELDHIEPRSRGGEDDWPNRTASCSACNRGKGTRSMLSWLLHLAERDDLDDLFIKARSIGDAELTRRARRVIAERRSRVAGSDDDRPRHERRTQAAVLHGHEGRDARDPHAVRGTP
jgi:hypothetical protein